MLLIAACCSFSGSALASPTEMPVPSSEAAVPEDASQLAQTGVFGIILAALFAGAVLYGLYDVLFDEDEADQPASP